MPAAAKSTLAEAEAIALRVGAGPDSELGLLIEKARKDLEIPE